MVDIFAFPNINAIPLFPEFLWKVLVDRNMSVKELAEKLNVSVEEINLYDAGVHKPSIIVLKKMSGIFGIRYRILKLAAGYSLVRPGLDGEDFFDFYDEEKLINNGTLAYLSRPYPDFYLPDGTAVDMDRLLSKAYYQNPSILFQLIEMLSSY